MLRHIQKWQSKAIHIELNKHTRHAKEVSTVKLGKRPLIYHMLLALALLIIPSTSGFAATGFSYGEGEAKNKGCLKCHGSQGTVGNSYFIDPVKFGHSTHAKIGCVTCHNEVTANHPNGRQLAHTTKCTECHGDIAAEYSKSPHAKNATCNGCHNPHQVYTPDETSGDLMNKQCTACHESYKIEASHSQWLPQAGLHLTAVPCVTCHSQAENYVVSIYIARRSSSKSNQKLEPANFIELRKLAGNDDLKLLLDKNKDGYISLSELRLFNRNPAYKHLTLKGMITPIKPTHSFRTFDNRWDCTSCHASGPETMQTSYVSFPAKNGTYSQVEVEKGAVLDALHAVPNFYMMGSTRNPALNAIGLLIIAGGMVMPVGHGFLRFLTRKNRQGKGH